MGEVLIRAAIQRAMHPYPSLGQPRLEEIDEWFDNWMSAIKGGSSGVHYKEVTGPIEQQFKFRCMADAMAADKMLVVAPLDQCDVKRHLRIHDDFSSRLRRRATTNPAPDSDAEEKTFRPNRRIETAIEPLRTPVLQGLIVEFLAALSELPRLKKKVILNAVSTVVDAINSPPYNEHGASRWPDGLWTPVITAVFEHKRLKYRFCNPAPDAPALSANAEFPLLSMREIARIDSVEKLKLWMARHDGSFVTADGTVYDEVALDWALQLNAVRCYKYLCTLPLSMVPAQHLTDLTHEHLYAQPQDVSADTPPLQPKTLRLMWGACGNKPAQDAPRVPTVHSSRAVRDRRRQWVREYLWHLVRCRVRVAKYAWHWVEEHEARQHAAVFTEDGRGLMLGQGAIDGLDAQARAKGIKVRARSALNIARDKDLAVAEAELVASSYGLDERLVREDSDSDDEGPVVKKPRRTYAQLFAAADGPREEDGGEDVHAESYADKETRRESRAEEERRGIEQERERCRIEELLIAEAEKEDDVQEGQLAGLLGEDDGMIAEGEGEVQDDDEDDGM